MKIWHEGSKKYSRIARIQAKHDVLRSLKEQQHILAVYFMNLLKSSLSII